MIKFSTKYSVLTPTGYKAFEGINKIENRPTFKFVTSSMKEIRVTEHHPFYINNQTVYACHLLVGNIIETVDGPEEIISISELASASDVYDLVNVEGNNTYYANDLLVHNCFLESGQSPIDIELIEELKANAKLPKIVLEDGDYKIFVEPIINHVYTIGVDVGEGIGQAASVIQIFDITDLTKIEQVAVYHNNKLDPHSFATKLFMIANQWGRPPLLVERNNCGGQVIDALIHNHQYMNLVDYIPDRKKMSDTRRGVYSHINSRYKGIMNMRYWMNTLRCVTLWDLATIHEIETFVRYPNGTWRKKTGENYYDDRVLAMVWALFALETEVTEHYFDVIKYDEKGKPLKIGSLELPNKEYFKLEYTAEVNDYEPLKSYFGVSPGGEAQNDKEELYADNWRIL
jgi:hypothetical protein